MLTLVYPQVGCRYETLVVTRSNTQDRRGPLPVTQPHSQVQASTDSPTSSGPLASSLALTPKAVYTTTTKMHMSSATSAQAHRLLLTARGIHRLLVVIQRIFRVPI